MAGFPRLWSHGESKIKRPSHPNGGSELLQRGRRILNFKNDIIHHILPYMKTNFKFRHFRNVLLELPIFRKLFCNLNSKNTQIINHYYILHPTKCSSNTFRTILPGKVFWRSLFELRVRSAEPSDLSRRKGLQKFLRRELDGPMQYIYGSSWVGKSEVRGLEIALCKRPGILQLFVSCRRDLR